MKLATFIIKKLDIADFDIIVNQTLIFYESQNFIIYLKHLNWKTL